jgi:hypothetical protein
MEKTWTEFAVEESNLPVQIAALRRVLGEAPGRDRWIERPCPAAATGSWAPSTRKTKSHLWPGSTHGQTVSRSCRSTISAMTRSSDISPTAWSRRSSPPSQHPLAVRYRPQFELHLQGPERRREARRPGTGVRYVLEGSARKSSNRVRITAQLIDANTGAHLWPIASTGHWKISSIFRKRSLRASPASSSPPYRRRKPHVRPRVQRTTSLPTISIYALMRWSGRWHANSRKRCHRGAGSVYALKGVRTMRRRVRTRVNRRRLAGCSSDIAYRSSRLRWLSESRACSGLRRQPKKDPSVAIQLSQ